MVDFWVVAGAGGSRKSSTIRSLVGTFYQVDIWDVELNGHLVKMLVQSASPQERKPFECPQDIVDKVTKSKENIQHVLIALRHTATAPVSAERCYGSPVNAIDYVDYFVNKAGWTPQGILITSTEPPATPLASKYPLITDHAPSLLFPYSASNAIANVVRARWGF